ncbi:hypothetical protein [Vibrio cyclitrophicus]|uniref:Uncharacterized protein n=1 Tax=Vibrio cyclitrophicus ZF270 TaxID=1136176 RepID=A0AAN0M3U9_9VIBR|nr:hypothetical protein [Vibrio cyclitrophicus]KAA8602673.1 hypothetical protein F0Z19_0206 [Vibrio cyclitrophicus]MBU2932005.1 hypothetical protein [Vibrio cyclitrophicus]OEE03387.1 hypothetical protein OC7_16075 [Vibrio cyclitrophicus ZF270]PME96084.1 hypothetical protein BCV26_01495 [Vibrio cyclitrophicus]PMF18155.1 hypothetical protein BCV24_11710 [Vibrio cyclitrophicus]
MFFKRLLALVLPVTFVFPAHTETFSERMERIEQENALAKTMTEAQVKLIQKVVQSETLTDFINRLRLEALS